MNADSVPPAQHPPSQSAAQRLAELRRRIESVPQRRPSLRLGGGNRLWLEHTLCILCAKAVRLASRRWPNGRDPRADRPTFQQHWRTVWIRWMNAAEARRALAKYHLIALRTPRR